MVGEVAVLALAVVVLSDLYSGDDVIGTCASYAAILLYDRVPFGNANASSNLVANEVSVSHEKDVRLAKYNEVKFEMRKKKMEVG
ncbi:hypothetical protein L1887_40674 [Cichorium endivia]|nr:hypothetical protein L1887_40674 [Cichorium endivia]